MKTQTAEEVVAEAIKLIGDSTQAVAEEVDRVPAYVESDVFAETQKELEAEAEKAAQAPKVDPTAAAMLRIAESMEKMMARQDAVRQIPINEVLPVSPWNPEGKRDHPKFTRPACLHGIAIDSYQHTAEEVRLWNQIKPGRYCDRRVEVNRLSDGTINLSWPGKERDKRIQFYADFPTIKHVLTAVIKEREAKEEARRKGIFAEDDEL